MAMNDSPKIPKTYKTVAALQGTDALLDTMMGLIDPIETLQRIYDSTPIEAIEFLYGDTPAVTKLKKAWSPHSIKAAVNSAAVSTSGTKPMRS